MRPHLLTLGASVLPLALLVVAVARFSARHDLTGADIWTTVLVLMAFGQVLARLGVLQIRRVRAISQSAAAPHRPTLTTDSDARWGTR